MRVELDDVWAELRDWRLLTSKQWSASHIRIRIYDSGYTVRDIRFRIYGSVSTDPYETIRGS